MLTYTATLFVDTSRKVKSLEKPSMSPWMTNFHLQKDMSLVLENLGILVFDNYIVSYTKNTPCGINNHVLRRKFLSSRPFFCLPLIPSPKSDRFEEGTPLANSCVRLLYCSPGSILFYPQPGPDQGKCQWSADLQRHFHFLLTHGHCLVDKSTEEAKHSWFGRAQAAYESS